MRIPPSGMLWPQWCRQWSMRSSGQRKHESKMKDNYNMVQENQKTELEWEHQTNHADIFAKSENSFFHEAGHVSIKCQTWSVHTCLLEKSQAIFFSLAQWHVTGLYKQKYNSNEVWTSMYELSMAHSSNIHIILPVFLKSDHAQVPSTNKVKL